MFSLAIDMLSGLVRNSSLAVNEYSVMSLNEFGTGPVGIGLLIVVIVVPLLVTVYCVRNCCCRLNRCCKPKEGLITSVTDLTKIKPKRKGLKRFLLPRKADKEVSPSKQKKMTRSDSYYDMETPNPAAATETEKETPLFIRRTQEGLKIYTDTD